MRKLKHKAALALTTAAMLACSVAVSAPANAASSPIAACGGGSYHIVDSYDLTGHPGNGSAMLYLLYNGTTNCVVTWLTGASVGTSAYMKASIQRASDGKTVTDTGYYKYYAGPVKLSASGTCVKWSGFAFGSYQGWTSGWSHCG
ncbi:hypothetical protein AB0H88_10775 [Nonomuraea sp. NPDC050680]|uniref:hypothetical protein n=1 Tax=Nonomuraea sp. NPDC050680 TaxID=3154630 RepID=UPI0033F3A807